MTTVNPDVLFFSACGIQHLQRGGNRQFGLFESFYFTIVTLSTVGFGDLYPDVYISQIFILLMICAALVIVPTQVSESFLTFICLNSVLASSDFCHRLSGAQWLSW